MRANEFIIESMSPNELRWLDDLADRLFNQLNIDVEFTKHFFDRANDDRGDYRDRQGRQHEQGITAEELAKVFVAAYKQAADQNSKFVKVTDIPANAEATIRDHFTKLNIPFVMKKAGGQKVLTPKTVMRKDNFANPPGTKAVPVNSKDVALDESLHDWFNKEKWVRMDTKGKIKGPCAREPGEGKPKCLPQSKAHSLGKKGRASAANRKRREDPNPERSGKAINVNTKKKTNEGVAEGARIARKPGQPAGSKKHSDLYTDENPKGTITGLKFATAEDARASVSKIRNSGRSHAHKIQAAVAMEQRAKAAGKAEAASVYRKYINATKKTEGVAEAELEELANTSLKVKEPKDFVNVNDRKQVTYKVMKFKSGKDTYLINFTVKGAPAFGKKQNWNAVNVAFGVREEQDDYSFGDEINTDLTARNKNQFLIYSTVINAVRKFITEYNTEIDEIIMQGAGERQEVMYQRFFQSAGKYFPGWHYDGKHSLVRDVPRQQIKKVKEQDTVEESCPHCNGPMFSEMIMNEKKDACYYKVKSRYKVWPSAYASGALVKCRNKGASNWGNGGKSKKS